jgi:predicted ArsR family transcriptional regulator
MYVSEGGGEVTMSALGSGGGPGQTGQDSTRYRILDLLRRHGRLSAPELAQRLDLSPVGVRRHLITLERDGLVRGQTERAPRGRPAARYSLTDSGRQTFPRHYDELAQEALSFLGAEGGRALHDFLAWRNERLAAEYGSRLRSGTVEGRARELADALTEQGFMAEVEEGADGLKLCQRNCTVEHIAAEHPDVCAWEAALFGRLLGVTVTRESTIVDGSVSCVTRVRSAEAGTTGQDRPQGGPGRQGAERVTPAAAAPTGEADGSQGPGMGTTTGGHEQVLNLNEQPVAPRQDARRPARSDA